MQEICIITLMGNYNYGNRLQNLALQHYIEKNGYKVVTWGHTTYIDTLKTQVKNLYSVCYKLFGIPRKANANLLLREYSFYIFNKNYIHIKKLKTLAKYKCFVGSDQVWAPAVISTDSWLLLEGITCKKKFSYAASLGEGRIPEHLKSVYFKGLSAFNKLSVRESKGIELINSLGITDVQWVLDPTLLLSADDWDKYAATVPALEEKKYIVLYFLSPVAEQTYDSAWQLAKETGSTVIDIMDNSSKLWYTKGPGEFLWIIKNAFCVLTDSFHGTIFSWIYKTPFFTYTRNSEVDMSSRIESLLDILGLKERLDMPCKFINLDINWTITGFYESMKVESERYIFECLNYGCGE